MKKIILLSLMLCSQISFAQYTLVVRGKGTTNNAGTYRCLIFSSENGFPKETAQAKQFDNGTIAGNTGTCVFENLPAGNYAVSTFHDKNNNQKLDKGLFGAPKEKYGFSKDASKPFGPPEFSEAAFNLSANAQIIIQLK